MFKGIVLSLGIIGMSFSTGGCKNDASASETEVAANPALAAAPVKMETAKREAAKPATEKPTADKSAKETAQKPATPEPATPVASETATAEPAAKADETTATAAEPKTPELTATEGVQLADLTVARGIESKRPLDPRTTYTLGEYERIYAFMSVLNPAETEDQLHVSFLNKASGKERGKVSVRVGAQKKWRTWAFSKSINKTGSWEILVRNSEELIIGRAPFEILPAE